MSRLLGVEIRRLTSRRLLRLLVLLLLATIVVVAVVDGVRSHRDVAAARAAAAAQAAQYARQAPPPAEQQQLCEDAKARGEAPPDANCEFKAPTAADFFADPRYRLATQLPNAVGGVLVGVGLLGVVVGASAIGAEWSAGTYAGLLAWEPRRVRVLTAKLLAILAVLGVVGVVALGLETLLGWVVAATRGTTAGTTGAVVSEVLLRCGRGLGLVALLSVAAASVAGLLRSTAGALGVAAAYLVGGELVLRGLRPGWERWLLTSNAGAIVTGRVQVVGRRFRTGMTTLYTLHAGRAAVYLGLGVVVLVAVSAVVLRRRDVT